MPESVEIPAPVRTTIRYERAMSALAISTSVRVTDAIVSREAAASIGTLRG